MARVTIFDTAGPRAGGGGARLPSTSGSGEVERRRLTRGVFVTTRCESEGLSSSSSLEAAPYLGAVQTYNATMGALDWTIQDAVATIQCFSLHTVNGTEHLVGLHG